RGFFNIIGRNQKFKLRHYQAALLACRPVAAGDAARGAIRKKRGVLPHATSGIGRAGLEDTLLVLPRVAMSASKPPFDSIRDLVASMPEASEASRQAVRSRQAELTKPLGSLGRLED